MADPQTTDQIRRERADIAAGLLLRVMHHEAMAKAWSQPAWLELAEECRRFVVVLTSDLDGVRAP